MKTVCLENDCVGCKACVDVCPKNAIAVIDSLISYNALIDESLCVKCDMCHQICQNNNAITLLDSKVWKQGWADDNIRKRSSSGGIASAIISAFIKNGGVVCSCIFKDGKFGFAFSETEEDSSKFRGSKYVKSDPEGIYKQIKKKLVSGIKVLFLGLPCQVAAVKLYIGDKYAEELYTVDLICHGTPSPQILEKFLNVYGRSLKSIEDISFRSKTAFRVHVDYDSLVPLGVQDTYTFAFLTSLDYTENCYRCRYAQSKRIADITLGDSWGSDLPIEERRKGVSLILCQTEKGKELLASSGVKMENVNQEKTIENNHQLQHPSVCPVKRDKFFKLLSMGHSFNKAVALCYPKAYYKQKLKAILIRLRLFKV